MTQAQTAATVQPDAIPVAAPVSQRWRVADVVALFELPFNDLLFRAQQVHREHFDANAVQLSTLLSIKTGGCEEDCGYCSQSSHDTGLKAEKLMDVDAVLDAARAAKANGASRFCMGAAWRNPKERHMPALTEMVRGVKELGLETCMTLGMLEDEQAQELASAGLDYYNHNLDTSPEFYGQVISTRTSGIASTRSTACVTRASTLLRRHHRHGRIAPRTRGPDLAAREPESVSGFGADQQPRRDRRHAARRHRAARPVRIRAHDRGGADHDAEGRGAPVGRPRAARRRAAGAVLAGANSMFYGDQLLTTSNPQSQKDRALFERLGIRSSDADAMTANA